MKKSLLTILCTLLSVFSWAQGTTAGDGSAEAYAVLTDNQDIISQDATGVTYGKTLTFYYDDQKSANNGMSVGPFIYNNGWEGREWDDYASQITTVVFDESFKNYTSLTSTTIWFFRLSSLTSIQGIENLNTSNVTEMNYMFYECSSLRELDLSHFDTSNVGDMRYMFYGCTNMTSFNLKNFNTSKVFEMGGMFRDCTNLSELDISSFDTQNVTDMQLMFSGCANLTTLDLSSFNTANVSSMFEMFSGCTNLNSIYVSETWSTARITSLEVGHDMFTGCTSLVGGAGTTYDAEHTDYTYARIDGGTSNPGYFTDKNAPTSYNIMVKVVGNGEVMAGQTTVMGGNEQEVTVLAGDSLQMYFFPAHDWTLGSLKVDDADVTSEVTRNPETGTLQYLLTVSGSHSVNVTFTEAIPEAYAVLTDNQDVISQGATGITYGKTLTFYYDTNKSSHSGAMSVGPFVEHSDREWNNVVNYITSVVFDESFANYTALTSTAQWFSGCSYLSSISGINNLKTDNVTDMHDMFVGCNFTTLDLSSFNTSNVTNMGYMFSGCSNMTSIDLSSFNTVKVASMNSMFHGCYALKTIYVGSEWTTSNVTESSEMFYGCSNLVGGAGTTYNANKIDYTYAHIDGGENNPGYFTDKNAPASYVITVTSYGNGQVSVEGVPEVVEDGKKAEVAVTAGGSLEMFFFPGEGYQLDSLMVDGINVTADVVPATEQSAASYTLNNINAVHNVITYFGEKASYNEAYAVLVSENNKVSLTLYYDGNKSRHSEGLAIGLDEMMTSQQFLGNREYIQEVTIDSSFVHCELTATISMFAEFSALTTINDLKYLKTDKVMNMWRMFYACPKLTSLDVSGFNTANVTNMEAMFEGCSSLASLDVSGFNTANVTTMQRMFMGCRALETIDVSHFNTEKVTDMGSMFESCGALRSIDVSHFNTANVTNMGNMFVNCAGLTSLDVTNFNTSNVTNLFSTFSGCTGLTTLDLSSFNTAKVTDMDKTFLNCSALTTIYAGSEWTTASVTDGSDPFAYCTRLVGGKGTTYSADHWDYTYARIDGGPNSTTPGYFTDKNAPITVAAPEFRFEGDNLTMTTETQNAGIFYKVADLPSMDDAVVESVVNSLIVTADGQSTYYDQPFELKKAAVVKAIAIIRNETATFVSDTTTMVYDYEAWVNLKAAVTSGVDLYSRAQGNPNVDTQLLEQLQWALNEGDMIYNNRAQMDSSEADQFATRIMELYTQIESQMNGTATQEAYVVLTGDSVSGMTATFFYDSLKDTHTTSVATVMVNDIRNSQTWFNNSEYIKSASFDASFASYYPTSTAYWFYPCNKLESIIGIEYLNTDNVTNMAVMFGNCASLTSIDLSRFKTDNVTDMSGMFTYCSKLTSIDLSNFNTQNVQSMNGMFGGCTGLENLNLSSFNTEKVTDMYAMFSNCRSLTSLDLSSFDTSNTIRMSGMFGTCGSLTNLDLSSFNTSNVTDMSNMFSGCGNLKTLDLSSFSTSKVTDMSGMFDSCWELTSVYVGNDWNTAAVTLGDNMFTNCMHIVGGSGTTYSADHEDYTYAHIDGGENNPGYFTDKNAPITVAAPEFRFEGDNLTMTTETQNAGIFYKVADLPSMDDAVVESVVNSLIVTADGQSTYYDQPFELKKAAVVKAIAIIRNETATFVSDTTTMVYDYEAWVNLKSAVESGVDLYGRAQGNPNVDTQLLEQLQWALNEGDMIYKNRAQMDSFEAKHFTQRINELCAQIEAQMTPTEKVETPYFRMESYYNNEVAIKTDTDEAEIYYTQNSRMIQGNDTDFGNGTWNLNWKVSGSNASYQVTSGGYNNTYCLKLTSATASTFGSAQAGYKFVNALTKDTYYTLRFKARSESGRGQLQVFCQNDTIDNTRSTVDTLAIGSELTDYEVTFKIKNENTNQVVLNFGAVADTYYIDNVLFGAVVSDTTNQMRTRYEQPINLREGATIKAVATKQGMLDSSPAVLDYFYDGWMNLRDVYEMAKAITYDCYGDPNVPLQMVQEVEVRVADRYSRLWDRRGREHVDDTELMDTYDELRYILDDLYRMKSGFTVDGVSYHAVDSTQVEVIPSLESYYRGAITVPATVNYNNINFRVTTVAQNAFRSEYLTAIIWNAGFALTATDLQSSQNPNLLLFVTEASMAPTDRDNVVINGFAKNIRLSEGGNFYCPQAFSAEAISYTREFKQQTQIGVSRGWETIALPFTVQTITHEQRGVIAPFGNTASNTHFWLRRLTSNGLQAVPTIEANTAYLISMPNSEEYIADYNLSGHVTFSAENATVPMTEVVKDESADYVMTPCFTNAAAKQGIYVLNVGEQRSGYPEGSIFESNYRAVLPFQAYVEHKGSNPAPPYFIVGDLGGDTTGIDATLVNSERVNSEAWYTLDGRKLQGKPTQKGVYITNGKKVIIK